MAVEIQMCDIGLVYLKIKIPIRAGGLDDNTFKINYKMLVQEVFSLYPCSEPSLLIERTG